MKKHILKITAISIAILALTAPFAESLETTTNLPEQVVLDYSTDKDAKEVKIVFGDGKVVSIRRHPSNQGFSLDVSAGVHRLTADTEEVAESAAIHIEPRASNAITLEFNYDKH
jgi:hypothetical protein